MTNPATTYQPLGNFIQIVDRRNRDLQVTKLLGLSIDKCFIPSIANTIGTDMSTYKIIQPQQFAYGPVTSRNGDKITIALYTGDEPAIISQAYVVFEITGTYDTVETQNFASLQQKREQLLPEYLMMWFRRPEFDRYARYHSHGSAREIFDWDEMCATRIPVPPIAEQRAIVAEYAAVQHRMEVNKRLIAKLEETAQTLYKKMFVDGVDKENLPDGWRMGKISDLGIVITGKTPSCDSPEDFGSDMPFITPGDFQGYVKFAVDAERSLSKIGYKKLSNKILPKGSVIVTCIGSDMGKVAIATENCITNQQMNSIKVSEKYYSDFLYYYLSSISRDLKGMALGSSTMPLLNKTDFEKIDILIPGNQILIEFRGKMRFINQSLLLYIREIKKLTELQSLLLARMGK